MSKQYFGKVGLIGWNGRNNAGDDVMTASILGALSNLARVDRVLIWGDESEIPAFDTKELSSISGIRYFNFVNKIRGLRRLIIDQFFVPRYLSDCDLIIIGGGSMFFSERSIRSFIRLIKKSKNINPAVLVVFCSVSLGPIKTDNSRQLLTELMSLVNYCTVRDFRSLKLSSEIGSMDKCEYFPDIAFSFRQILSKHILEQNVEENETIIGVSLRFGYVDSKVINTMKIVINYIENSLGNYSFRIFEFCDFDRGPDRNERDKFLSLLSSEHKSKLTVVTYKNNPEYFYSKIATVKMMVCMRLHACIFSCALGVPFLSIPYSQKCFDFVLDVAKKGHDSIIYNTDQRKEVERKVSLSLEKTKNVNDPYENDLVTHSAQQIGWLLNRF